jgi:ribosomal protein L29
MADEKKLTDKEMDKKMKELKIELLKQTTKRKGIKREIARLLTVKQNTEKKNK